MSLGHCSANIMTLSQKRFLDSDDWKEYQKHFLEMEMKRKTHSCEDGFFTRINGIKVRKIANRKPVKREVTPGHYVRQMVMNDDHCLNVVVAIEDYIRKNRKDFIVPVRYKNCKTKVCRYNAEVNGWYTGFTEKTDKGTRVYISYDNLIRIMESTSYSYKEARSALIKSGMLFESKPYNNRNDYTRHYAFTGENIRYYVIDGLSID